MLLLDSGNLSGNPSPAGELKTRRLVESMDRLGYRAVNVGERDLALGYDRFRSRTEGVSFPFVSTNIVRKDTGDPMFEPFVVLNVERPEGPPIRVGVLGVVRFNPIFLKAGPDGTNLVIAKPDEQLEKYVPEVRKKSDVVVLLAALHRDDARRIVSEIPGIDLVIGAYGGMYNTRDEQEGDTLLLYSGNQGKRLGESRIFLDGEARGLDATNYLHFLTTRYPLDEEWSQTVADILREAREASGRAGAGSSAIETAPAAPAAESGATSR